MKTYNAPKAMVECTDGSGAYVDRADFEEESARLASLQNRFSVLQLEYQNVSAKLKSTRLELEVKESKLTDLGIAHMETVVKLGQMRWWLALVFCINAAVAIALVLLWFYR